MNNSAIQSQGDRLAAHKELIGKVIAQRYKIKALIGLGGMGAVYQAEHALIGQPVAIKVLHKEFAHHPEGVARFQREARAAATINHLNICAPTDFGRLADGSLFLVMEFLRGQTLAREIELGGGLPTRRVVDITRQLCNVLSKAHAEGIVHRDLKPENIILLEWEGEGDFIKVLDFGLASMHRHEPNGVETAALTRVGIPFGTPAYMPPEQVEGQPVDGRADLYALGAMMFEMLTGKRPFESKSIPEILTMHLREPPPSLLAVAPEAGISPQMEALVHKLMAKKPEDRYADADELYKALMATPEAAGFESQRPGRTLPVDARALAPTLGVEDSMFRSSHGQKIGAAFDALPTTYKIGMLSVMAGVILAVMVVLILAVSTDPDDPIEGGGPPSAMVLEGARGQGQPEGVRQIMEDSLLKSRETFLETYPALRPLLQEEEAAAADPEQAEQARAMLEETLAEDKAIAKNPHFHYYRGVVWEKEDKDEALAAYLTASELDERYAFSPEVTGRLMDAVASKDDEISARATALLMQPNLKVRGTTLLGEMATRYRRKNGRKAAYQWLQAHPEMMEMLPAWRKNDMALRHASGCAEHAEAIKRMVKSKDPGSIPMIKSYIKRRKSGCGFLRRKDCIGCIRDDLAKALKVLEPLARRSSPNSDVPTKE